jgi:hypothetical protein
MAANRDADLQRAELERDVAVVALDGERGNGALCGEER